MMKRILAFLFAVGSSLAVSPAYATLTFVQAAGNWGITDTVTATFGSNATVGHLILVAWAEAGGSIGTGPSLSGFGASWTSLGCESSASEDRTCLWAGIVITANDDALTVSGNVAPYSFLTIVEMSGNAATITADGTAGTGTATNSTTVQISPAYSSSNANDVIWCAQYSAYGPIDTSPGSPWNDLTIQNTQFQATYQVVSTTGSFAPSWTVNPSEWSAICIGVEGPSVAPASTPSPSAIFGNDSGGFNHWIGGPSGGMGTGLGGP